VGAAGDHLPGERRSSMNSSPFSCSLETSKDLHSISLFAIAAGLGL
jgi:hypothetical protein